MPRLGLRLSDGVAGVSYALCRVPSLWFTSCNDVMVLVIDVLVITPGGRGGRQRTQLARDYTALAI